MKNSLVLSYVDRGYCCDKCEDATRHGDVSCVWEYLTPCINIGKSLMVHTFYSVI